MNHVTFETALKLKEAGFPQPMPEYGQSWYHIGVDRPFMVIRVDGVIMAMGDAASLSEKYPLLRTDVLPSKYAFAPTAIDILAELGWYYDISYNDISTQLWHVTTQNITKKRHKNPAEAAAFVWLETSAE